MLKKIVLASKNKAKIREIEAILSGFPLIVKSLNDYPDMPDVIEDGLTFFQNAYKKAKTISEWTSEPALADDSGLEVNCLNGEPGIFSARYAGSNASDIENISKLLDKMRGIPVEQRGAAFRCVVVLYQPNGECFSFEGGWNGAIAEAPAGRGGFGYDPVFYLADRGVTVADLLPEVKNKISHRAQALNELKNYLKHHNTIF